MTAQLAGDARLGLRLAALLGRRHPVAAAAVVTPSAVRTTANGADLDTRFELAALTGPHVPTHGARASITNLAWLLEALLDGTAGTGAGACWSTMTLSDREIGWRHGPGFWVGLDLATGTGVAIVSATPTSVDGAGVSLLASP